MDGLKPDNYHDQPDQKSTNDLNAYSLYFMVISRKLEEARNDWQLEPYTVGDEERRRWQRNFVDDEGQSCKITFESCLADGLKQYKLCRQWLEPNAAYMPAGNLPLALEESYWFGFDANTGLYLSSRYDIGLRSRRFLRVAGDDLIEGRITLLDTNQQEVLYNLSVDISTLSDYRLSELHKLCSLIDFDQ